MVQKWSSDAKLGALKRPKYGREIPQRRKKREQKKRYIKLNTVWLVFAFPPEKYKKKKKSKNVYLLRAHRKPNKALRALSRRRRGGTQLFVL
jgi:hypothetical protein